MQAGSPLSLIAPILPLERPAEISLEAIWTALESLHKVCANFVKLSSDTILQVGEIKTSMGTLQQKQIVLESDLAKIQNIQVQTLADKVLLQRKIENLENKSRTLNLRILNFPVSSFLSPRDMFCKFLKEKYKYLDQTLPPLQKLFYLPSISKSPQSVIMAEPLPAVQDISAFLEQSQEEISTRATLSVSFVFLQDKEALLRAYFQQTQPEFLGGKISMFPDISKWTQLRRKKFLTMKQEVLTLQARFQLRYPCKCILIFKDKKYIFYDPPQLQTFLDGHGDSGPV